MSFTLKTVALNDQAIGCIECNGDNYALTDLARHNHWPDLPTTVIGLFVDWAGNVARLNTACDNLAGLTPLPPNLPLLAPLQYPGKLLCAGANYYDHNLEMGVTETRKEATRLFFFFKAPLNSVVGPGDTVHMPLGTQKLDWEVELAAVIGKRARAVSVESALDYVGAYTGAIDISCRDLGRAPDTFYKIDWMAAKAHDDSCPMGPCLLPAQFAGDAQDLGLKLWVNGELKQNGRTSGMIYNIAEQIATLSRIMTLHPGDVILTGTPAGVGAPKGTFLRVGDTVAVEFERIGKFEVCIKPSLP